MDRRSLLKLAALVGVSRFGLKAARAEEAGPVVVLYNDLAVDPKREQELLRIFHRQLKPAAEKFEGYIDVKLLKLQSVLQGGPAPAPGFNYRYQLTFKTEELRRRWVASSVHRATWPLVEGTLVNKGYLVLLTENV